MDDKNFDKVIKEKADAFLDSGHDADALSDLRRRLSDLPAKKNIWAGRRTAYIIGSMALFTLINFGIVWYFSEGRYAALSDEVDQLKSERSQFISLQEELVELKSSRIDTVYVYRDLLTIRNAGVAGLQNGNEALVPGNGYESPQSDPLVTSNADYGLTSNHRITGPGMPKGLPEVAIFEQPESPIKPEKKRIPNKTLWAMEKHNHRGLDFQFGVEGMFYQSIYDVGTGDINGGMGLMTEIIFAPMVRLETGIQFGGRSYRIDENEIQELPPDFFDDYPGYDGRIGQLIGLESDANLVKVPVNLKIFGILDHNKKWYLSAGLTPQWATRQELEYKYAIDTPEPPGGDLDFVSFIGSKKVLSPAFYVTTLNLGAGTEVYLNKQLRWQIGVFYQKGLSKAGIENRKLHGYGVKSSIWFNKP